MRGPSGDRVWEGAGAHGGGRLLARADQGAHCDLVGAQVRQVVGRQRGEGVVFEALGVVR
ncbi:hypothetical protein [Nocardiopsis chromatogenes]|uniref:hypothetical protein n=1 Tax=Nocardiopsis chromatogenes TaxID=280239 RepID=UPI001EF9F004|nr:hypothetical protein [Nocardiopsis chromatogenes]